MRDWLDIPAWTDNFDPGVGDGPPLYTELAGSESPYMIPGDNHPNELGHKIIAKKIESIIKLGKSYPDAKKIHLDRLKRDHEKILKPTDHTDYN